MEFRTVSGKNRDDHAVEVWDNGNLMVKIFSHDDGLHILGGQLKDVIPISQGNTQSVFVFLKKVESDIESPKAVIALTVNLGMMMEVSENMVSEIIKPGSVPGLGDISEVWETRVANLIVANLSMTHFQAVVDMPESEDRYRVILQLVKKMCIEIERGSKENPSDYPMLSKYLKLDQ